MSESLRKFLINSAVGLVLALLVSLARDIFHAANASEVLRCLCDGFFVAAAMLLAAGGLRWTYNGGAMDGLSYTAKTGIARMRKNYEQDKVSFAQYREEREKKSKSPQSLLLAGLAHLGAALVLLAVYSHLYM